MKITQQFSNTDAELARCIKARLRHEFNRLPHKPESKEIVREYLRELTNEIINEEF